MSQSSLSVGQPHVTAPTETQTTQQATPATQQQPINGVTTGTPEPAVAGSNTGAHPLIGTEPSPVNVSGMQHTENQDISDATEFPTLHGSLSEEAIFAANALSYGTKLLSLSPSGMEQGVNLQHDINTHTNYLLDLKAGLSAEMKVANPKLEGQIENMIETLAERADYIQTLKEADPTTPGALRKNRRTWAEGMIDAINSWVLTMHARAGTLDQETMQLIQELEQAGDELKAELRAHADRLTLSAPDDTSIAPQHGVEKTPKELEKEFADAIQKEMGQKHASKQDIAAAKQEVRERFLNTGTISEDNGVLSEQQVMETIGTAFAERHGLDPSRVKHDLEKAHQGLLERQMHSFSSTIAVNTPDGTQNYESEMTLAKDFGTKTGHDFGTTGTACDNATSSVRSTNTWESKLKAPDGRTLLSGIRHGVHSAYGFAVRSLRKESPETVQQFVRDLCPQELMVRGNDGEPDIKATAKAATSLFSIRGMRIRNAMREKANENRARDMLAGVIERNPKVLEQLAAGKTTLDPITLNSVSLMTPDALRAKPGFFGFKTQDNERRMLAEQTAAFKKASANPIELTYTNAEGEEVKAEIKVNVRTFNFGVNKGAVSKKVQVVAPSWGHANATVNNEAMTSLLGIRKEGAFAGAVGEFLGRPDVDPKTRAEVKELATQIRDIWNSGDYSRTTGDPYALPSRLVLLSNKMGDSTAWNCKSGKDRTGELDAEAKFLAIRMDQTGTIPKPGKLDTIDQGLFRNVTFASGNHKIQEFNTGGGGFKLEGVKAITERLGSMLAKLIHRGQSRYIAS